MSDTALQRLAASRARELRRAVGTQILDLREERGLSQREVAAEVGLDRSWLAKAEAGEANLTVEALAKLATAIGAKASLRLYPETGPRLRDGNQVRLIEALLEVLHPHWRVRLEVPVYRPVHGVIDLVLIDPVETQLVGGEAHSEIRRAERQLRWAAEKDRRAAIGRGMAMDGTPPTRLEAPAPAVDRRHEDPGEIRAASLRRAYPGRSSEAVDALRERSGRFPDAAIIWVDLRGTASRILDAPPRGIVVGR